MLLSKKPKMEFPFDLVVVMETEVMIMLEELEFIDKKRKGSKPKDRTMIF